MPELLAGREGQEALTLQGFGSDFTSKALRCFQVRLGVGRGLRHWTRKAISAAFREPGPLVPCLPKFSHASPKNSSF